MDLEIAESTRHLEVKRAEFNRETKIAQLEALKAEELRLAELQREVESKRVNQEMEALRAEDLVQATVDAESKIMAAKGDADAKRQEADADRYSQERQAEGKLALVEAEVKGLERRFMAQAVGLRSLLDACWINPDLMKFYIACEAKLYQSLADANAKAVQNMNPKIQVWAMDGKDHLFEPHHQYHEIVAAHDVGPRTANGYENARVLGG